MAALFLDHLSIDAAELIASRIHEIDNTVIVAIRQRAGGGRLEREHVREILNERARARKL